MKENVPQFRFEGFDNCWEKRRLKEISSHRGGTAIEKYFDQDGTYKVGFMACGECRGIYKQTRNRTKTDCQYWWDMALKEIRKLEPNFKPPKGYVDYGDFPNRPKWMRYPRFFFIDWTF